MGIGGIGMSALARYFNSRGHKVSGYDRTESELTKQLVKEGMIGSLTEHAFTFMGGIYSSRRVRDELAPLLTECLLAEQADLALLVPA